MKFIKCDKNDAIFKQFFDKIKDFDENKFLQFQLCSIRTKNQDFNLEDLHIYIPRKFCKFP